MVVFTLEAPTKAELEAKIENYYANYHPAGYGTHIKEPKLNPDTGKWEAHGTRGASCD